jgi:hypothetical protein
MSAAVQEPMEERYGGADRFRDAATAMVLFSGVLCAFDHATVATDDAVNS